MQELTLPREARSSIEVDRDARGIYRWAIKIYWDQDNPDAHHQAIERADLIDRKLKLKFLGS